MWHRSSSALLPAPALPPRCLHCQQTIETYLGAWQSPAKLHPGPASCQGSLCLPRLCSAARARLPFPSRLLQAAISHTGRTRVPSVLHVPAMPHTQGHGSCPSQPAKLSARNAMCVPLPRGSHVPQCHVQVAGLMVFMHAVCGLLHLCALAVLCCMCLGEIACCVCPLSTLLRTQTRGSSWHVGVVSRRVLPP